MYILNIEDVETSQLITSKKFKTKYSLVVFLEKELHHRSTTVYAAICGKESHHLVADFYASKSRLDLIAFIREVPMSDFITIGIILDNDFSKAFDYMKSWVAGAEFQRKLKYGQI